MPPKWSIGPAVHRHMANTLPTDTELDQALIHQLAEAEARPSRRRSVEP